MNGGFVLTVLGEDFFHRDALDVAPQLLGKMLVTNIGGEEKRVRITETEVYRGVEDTACHAHKGRTRRTELLFGESGIIYVYLCYGMHWLMNIITGEKDQPQGVLIRAAQGYEGPARLTKYLGVTGELNGASIVGNPIVRIEDDGGQYRYICKKRVGGQG